jgi:hypothetical protein
MAASLWSRGWRYGLAANLAARLASFNDADVHAAAAACGGNGNSRAVRDPQAILAVGTEGSEQQNLVMGVCT